MGLGGPTPSHYWITDGGGCKTRGGSPLCDTCGHPRATHSAFFQKGERACRFKAADVQSLSYITCSCVGYVPVTGRLGEATFAQPETGPLSRLRTSRI